MNPSLEVTADNVSIQIGKLCTATKQSNYMSDQLGWERCMKITKELIRNYDSAAEAYLDQSILFALKGDRENACSAFEKSRRLSTPDDTALIVYITNSNMLAKPKQTYPVIASLFASAQANNEFGMMISMLHRAIFCCMFSTAKAILAKSKQLKRTAFIDTLPLSHIHSVSETNKLLDFLSVCTVNEQDLVERLDVAANVAFTLGGAPLFNQHITSTPTGIMYKFPLSLPTEKLVDINWAIADALAEQFDDPMDDFITFSASSFYHTLRS